MKKGFTLIEVIVVVAILAVLILLAFLTVKPQWQMAKAQDSQRKADLLGISDALEDYLNDNPCYPEESVFADCGGDELSPYLKEIPCDPQTKQPYTYDRPDTNCRQYAIYADLVTENLDITYGGRGNLAVSSPNYRLTPEKVGVVVPTEPAYGLYGCYDGECRQITGQLCSPNYAYSDCVVGEKFMCEGGENECEF